MDYLVRYSSIRKKQTCNQSNQFYKIVDLYLPLEIQLFNIPKKKKTSKDLDYGIPHFLKLFRFGLLP